jgi:hypothetical protein
MSQDPDLDVSADAPSGRIIPRDPDALLFSPETAYLAATSIRTLEAWRARGGGPPYVQIGRSIRYRRGDVLEWLAERRRTSTSDPGSADQRDSSSHSRGESQ